jgi:hypothetical protein
MTPIFLAVVGLVAFLGGCYGRFLLAPLAIAGGMVMIVTSLVWSISKFVA